MAIEAHIAMYFWVKYVGNVLLFAVFIFLKLYSIRLGIY